MAMVGHLVVALFEFGLNACTDLDWLRLCTGSPATPEVVQGGVVTVYSTETDVVTVQSTVYLDAVTIAADQAPQQNFVAKHASSSSHSIAHPSIKLTSSKATKTAALLPYCQSTIYFDPQHRAHSSSSSHGVRTCRTRPSAIVST